MFVPLASVGEHGAPVGGGSGAATETDALAESLAWFGSSICDATPARLTGLPACVAVTAMVTVAASPG